MKEYMKGNKRELFLCEHCGRRFHALQTGHGMIGTVYMDGGRDERWLARLECGHLIEVYASSRGYNKSRELVYYPVEEFEDCRI